MSESSKPYVYNFDLSDLDAYITERGLPSYRTQQIWQGLYHHLWDNASDFTVLPLALRQTLIAELEFSRLTPIKQLRSKDGETLKTLFRLPDGQTIEAVLMRYTRRRTLCISTQAGCAMGCVFCATGQMGFRRNLTSGEIVEQVIYYARQLAAEGERVSNIVLMGMGEPFHNYDATMSAIERLNNSDGYNFGIRRFTVSTVGLVPLIEQFTEENRQINLAVSLHSVSNELRSSLLPINRRYPVELLLDACRRYVESSKRRITFEWALIHDVNDSRQAARQLASQIKHMLCHVNVIPLNPTEAYSGETTPVQRARAFKAVLERHGVPCTVRIRRGIDIQAGCGQLASNN